MKILVCITKTAEVEVDLDEAKAYLTNQLHDIRGWTNGTIAEVFVEVAEDLDPEFSTDYVTAVTQFEEAA